MEHMDRLRAVELAEENEARNIQTQAAAAEAEAQRTREEEERLRREEEERKRLELELAEKKAKEAKTTLSLALIGVYMMLFPGEFDPLQFSSWRKLIPTSVDEIRLHPGKTAEIPSAGTTYKTVARRQIKRNHMGIPLPSGKSLNDASVTNYSGYDDIRLWLDPEAWIGDHQAVDAMIVAMETFITLTFQNRINMMVFKIGGRSILHYGRSPEAVSTIIVDTLLELFNEMCLVPGNLAHKAARREPGPFFKSHHFTRLSKAAKDRMPNAATHYKGAKAET